MTLDVLDFVSLLVTALLIPTFGGVMWVVKALVKASIEHTAELTKKFDALSNSINELIKALNKNG